MGGYYSASYYNNGISLTEYRPWKGMYPYLDAVNYLRESFWM